MLNIFPFNNFLNKNMLCSIYRRSINHGWLGKWSLADNCTVLSFLMIHDFVFLSCEISSCIISLPMPSYLFSLCISSIIHTMRVERGFCFPKTVAFLQLLACLAHQKTNFIINEFSGIFWLSPRSSLIFFFLYPTSKARVGNSVF